MSQYALLSVSDKTNIVTIAEAFVNQGIQLLSTGGTYTTLKEAHLPVTAVSDYTGVPEMLAGRVKTLHPKIHAGLLARRDDPSQQQTLVDQHIPPIDYVVVNLYPFQQTLTNPEATAAEWLENIDIGGPAMLRSAAKNYEAVSVVTDVNDYETVIQQLNDYGETTLDLRRYLAKKAFQLTAHYDALISDYFATHQEKPTTFTPYDWDYLTLTYGAKQPLRYGENSHQAAAFYKMATPPAFSLANAKVLHGKALSYNNLKDADAAISLVREFAAPVAVGLKHMNPCGVGTGKSIEVAFDRCLAADDVSIYGGIVAVNRPVTLALAEKLAKIFLEIVIAPDFEPAAYQRLAKKKNVRLLTLDFDHQADGATEEYVSVSGGLLAQQTDHSNELMATDPTALPESWSVASGRIPTVSEIRALNFAMKVVKHVKSNAIVVANENMTLGVGAGQPNRVGAAQIALDQAALKDAGLRQPLVLASDAFLPMADTAQLAAERGVSAIIQPGGSIHDADSIAVTCQHNLAMVMTGKRHFRH